MAFLLPFVLGFAAGALPVFLFFAFFRRKLEAAASESLIKLQAEKTFLEEQKEALEKDKAALLSNAESGRERESRLREESVRLAAERAAAEESFKKEMESQKNFYKEKIQDQERHFAKELEAQKSRYEELAEKSKELAKTAKVEFENIAQKIFKETSKTHREESQKDLSQLLNPLREDISQFGKSILSIEKQEESFKETIKGFTDINQQMRDSHRQFTQTLKGGARVQGQWGEFVLESILEKSGLREGEDFVSQGKGMGLKGEKGEALRPDVIVNLPEGKHIAVDAKVSLASYHKFCSAERGEDKKRYRGELESSFARHIENLSEKKYHKGLKAPDFTLMFIPSEGVFSLLTQSKQGLFEKAWKKSIVIVSPTTLYATLKTIASIWKIEQYNKNAEEIAKEGGRLYDKFVGFLESMTQIDKSLKAARDSYEKAANQLKGHGSLMRKAESLKKIGGKILPSKILPAEKAAAEEPAAEKTIIQGIEQIKQLGADTGGKEIPKNFLME